MSLEIIKEKVAQAVDILNEKNIDMWVTFVQETKVLKDPIMNMIVGDHSTWKSAFIINKDGDTTAIVGDMELENFVKSGVYKNIVGYLKSVSYKHLRAHETVLDLVCRLLLEKKKKKAQTT